MTKILEECKKAVENEIRLECREEAMQILRLASKEDRKEFLKYHKRNQGNVCCLVLDFAKKKLLESGKLEQKESDYFKGPIYWNCMKKFVNKNDCGCGKSLKINDPRRKKIIIKKTIKKQK